MDTNTVSTSTNGESGAAEEPSATTANGGQGKGKARTKKGKGKDDATTLYCANCGEEGDARCGGCGVVYYCRKNIVIKNGKKVNLCQQVPRTSHTRAPARTHSIHPLT